MGILLIAITWFVSFIILFEARVSIFHLFFPAKKYNSVITGCLILILSYFCISALIIISTELLSFFSIISTISVGLFWTITSIISGFIAKNYFLKNTRSVLKYIQNKYQSLSFLSLGASFYLLILFIIAIYSPPNGWDSMTYHIARVAHWIDNGNVNHYPTHIIRQLFQPPFCEYLMLHFNILSQSDLFSNMVQYIHFILSIPALCLIQYTITGKYSFWEISIVYITIPMVLLHACSTQNDLSFGFWFLSSLFIAFNAIMNRMRISNFQWVLLGFSLGIGFLVKGTSLFYFAPLVLVFIIYCLKNISVAVIKGLTYLAIIFIFVISFHTFRNYKTFETPAGGSKEQVALYKNESLQPNIAISNTIRNFCLHLTTPLKSVNATAQSILEKFHTKILRIDINDKKSTYIESSFSFGAVGLGFNEVSSSNFIHACLILLSLFFIRIISKNKLLLVYFIVVIAGFICLAFILKWQHSYSRLHTPFFMAYVPILAYLMDYYKIRFIYFFLLLAGLPWLLMNNLHPLISHSNIGPLAKDKSIFTDTRNNIRFKNRENIELDYLKAFETINQLAPQNIGLIMGDNEYDYLMWYYLKSFNKEQVHFEHIEVTNESKKYNSHTMFNSPDIIVSTIDKGESFVFSNKTYSSLSKGNSIFIYK